jgi:hypothetical protein
MTGEHSVQTCRWAQATILLPRPYWFDASRNAWSCLIDGAPEMLVDPLLCRTCERWTPADHQDARPPVPHPWGRE